VTRLYTRMQDLLAQITREPITRTKCRMALSATAPHGQTPEETTYEKDSNRYDSALDARRCMGSATDYGVAVLLVVQHPVCGTKRRHGRPDLRQRDQPDPTRVACTGVRPCGRPQAPKVGQARDLLHAVASGSKITEAEARSIFNSPWYQAYIDTDTGLRAFFDGRDGRELLTHESSSRRLYQLYDTARQWLNRCGTALPLPAGC
jgi:hypothetical protein